MLRERQLREGGRGGGETAVEIERVSEKGVSYALVCSNVRWGAQEHCWPGWGPNIQ